MLMILMHFSNMHDLSWKNCLNACLDNIKLKLYFRFLSLSWYWNEDSFIILRQLKSPEDFKKATDRISDHQKFWFSGFEVQPRNLHFKYMTQVILTFLLWKHNLRSKNERKWWKLRPRSLGKKSYFIDTLRFERNHSGIFLNFLCILSVILLTDGHLALVYLFPHTK